MLQFKNKHRQQLVKWKGTLDFAKICRENYFSLMVIYLLIKALLRTKPSREKSRKSERQRLDFPHCSEAGRGTN